MKKEYINSIIVIVIVLIIGGLVWYNSARSPMANEEPVSCTQEAKLCPDGSYVGRTGPQCQFAVCPGMDSWKTFTDTSNGVTFRYPETISTKYIALVDWPPKIQLINGPLTCTQAGNVIDRAGKTESRIINGKEYCVTTVSEGAAGSTYNQYAYATAIGNKVAILTFTLRYPECANYDDPKKSECEAERTTFTIDPIIGEIVGTIVL